MTHGEPIETPGLGQRYGRSTSKTGTVLGYPGKLGDSTGGVRDTDWAGSTTGSRRSDPLAQTRTLLSTTASGQALALTETGKRFETIRPLGAGSMGEVALVRDQDIERTVAVKSLRINGNPPAAVARFVEEIRTIGRLEHPNIAPIHDVGVDDSGAPYFVMKYVDGEDLATIIDKLHAGDAEYHRRFTIDRRMQIFLGLLRALEFAHDHGVIHRDVKPENIMVGQHGEVTLMDWGIAKYLGDHEPAETLSGSGTSNAPARLASTQDGEIIGTPLYMSPEQARGANSTLDVRTDLFSAAVVFHELLTLRHYLSHVRDLDELLHDLVHVGWRNSLLAWHRSVQRPMPPMELYHYLRKGLQRDPTRRYQTAREMIERLEGLLEGKVPVQCHITLVKSTVRRLGRLVDRHPWLSFVGFTALIGTTGVGLYNAIF